MSINKLPERLTGEFFTASCGDCHLAFSPRASAAVVLTDAEQALLQVLQRCPDREAVIRQLGKDHAGRLGVTCEQFSVAVERFAESMVAAGVLSGPSASNNSPSVTYSEKPFAPALVYLHVTDRCNLNCWYCYNSEYRQRHLDLERELTDEEWIDVIEQSLALGTTNFIFSGGEPLLRPSCLDLARHIRHTDVCWCELLTNGTLIERYQIDELFGSFSSITVSIDGHVPSLHEPMRGRGTFERVRKALESLCAVSPERVSLRPVLHRDNVDELEHFVEWAHQTFGITRIQSAMYSPNDISDPTQLESLISVDQYAGVLRCNERLGREGKIQFELPELAINRGCGAGSGIVSVGSRGEVFPCQAMHCEELVAGNVRHAPLHKIGKNSSVLKAVRNLKSSDIEGCRDCNLISLCGGGCRAIAHTFYGDIRKRNDLLCPSYVRQCEQLLWQQIRPKGDNVCRSNSTAAEASRTCLD